MINWGNIPVGAVIPFPFDTFAASTGAPVTMSGLAVTDIEVYKGTSMTQRSSDNGFALMDTDGIDIDSRTGIHGFSIDTSDNTDAGFYAAGSFYWVVVDAITVDSQTLRFIAGTFRLVAAESSAGVPKVDLTHVSGSSVSTSSAQIGVNVVNAGGTAWGSGAITAASIATDAITNAKIAADAIGSSEIADGAITAAKIGADAITNAKIADNAIAVENIADGAITAAKIANGAIDAATFAADVDAEILSYLVDDATRIDASALNTATGTGVNVSSVSNGAITAAAIANGAITAGKIATDAIDADALAADAIAEINATVDTAISDAALATASALATVDSNVDAIKAVTDNLPDSGALTSLATAAALTTVDGVVDAIKVTTDKLDDTLEDQGGGTYGFTEAALQEAPTGGSAPTAGEIADAVWDEDLTGHTTEDSAGEILGNVATGTPPTASAIADAVWDEALSGHTSAGTAGKAVGDILEDTSTTLQGEIDGIQADTEDIQSKIGTPSNLGSGATVAANLSDIEAQTDDIGAAGAGLTALASASALATVDSNVDAILADTNELQGDWANGGRLDLLIDAIKAVTDALTSPATIATAVWASGTRLLTAGTNIVLAKGTGVTGFNDLSAAQVNAEVDTALSDYDGPTKAELDAAVADLALEATAQSILEDTAEIGAAGAGLTAIPWNAAWDAQVESEVADALEATIADSIPSDGTAPSVKQALYMLTQFMVEREVSSTTVTVKKPDGSTTLFTLALDDGTSPTSITRSS